MIQTMRQTLLGLDESLYRKFKECYDTAMVEWLPAISQKNGSYNSLPHLLNVEKKIDDILFAPQNADFHEIVLNAPELYILLCAVLLHDIGKANDQFNDHAKTSAVIVKKSWAKLRLASETFARIIADVVQFHDCAKMLTPSCKQNCSQCKEPTIRDLTSNIESLEKYGVVRVKMLAVLLFLADHLDGAKGRVAPDYVCDPGEVVREFRQNICDHKIDIESRMICTVVDTKLDRKNKDSVVKLSEPVPDEIVRPFDLKKAMEGIVKASRTTSLPEEEQKNLGKFYKETGEDLERFYKKNRACQEKRAGELDDLFKEVMAHDFEPDHRKNLTSIKEKAKPPLEKCYQDVWKTFLQDKVKQIIRQVNAPPCRALEQKLCTAIDTAIREAHERRAAYARQAESRNKNVYVIIKNYHENRQAFQRIKRELGRMGLPLEKWLLECDTVLYRIDQANDPVYSMIKTYEPTLSHAYLEKVFEHMKKLSSGIFGVTYYTYEQLLDILREPHENMHRIQDAIKRLKSISENFGTYANPKEKESESKPETAKYLSEKDDQTTIPEDQREKAVNSLCKYEIYWNEKKWALFLKKEENNK